MSVKGKLVTVGAVAGCIGTAVLVINWNLLTEKEGYFWEGSATPESAKTYVKSANDLNDITSFGRNPIQWYMMRLSPTMRAHLEQRKREAEAYEATLPKAPPPLSDAERRKKMRDDYEKSAAAIHLSPGMTAAMLALIDQANARAGAIPIRVTVKNTVQPGEDLELERANGGHGIGIPTFNPEYGCDWDMRQHSEPLDITSLFVQNEGIFITITLKDVPEPLVLRETIEGESRVLSVRQLGATVEVNVVPPVGPAAQASRELGLGGFAFGAKLRKGDSIARYSIYTEQIKMLSGNACFEVCTLLGTRDHLPNEPE